MAIATASSTPNPNAKKFTLDAKLTDGFNATELGDHDNAFVRAVMALDGVVAVFGVNDFVTVTRRPDADWDQIVPAVVAAAAAHL
jgi:hypothetical protein